MTAIVAAELCSYVHKDCMLVRRRCTHEIYYDT